MYVGEIHMSTFQRWFLTKWHLLFLKPSWNKLRKQSLFNRSLTLSLSPLYSLPCFCFQYFLSLIIYMFSSYDFYLADIIKVIFCQTIFFLWKWPTQVRRLERIAFCFIFPKLVNFLKIFSSIHYSETLTLNILLLFYVYMQASFRLV